MLRSARWQAANRELSAAQRIPYTGHVSPTVIKTSLGDYVQAFRLAGISFESCDDDQLNNWHERLNAFWRNIASPHVAIWTHLIRGRERPMASRPVVPLEPAPACGFAGELEEKYQQGLLGESLMSNEIYLAIVYRPTPAAAAGWMTKVLARPQANAGRLEVAEAIDTCEKLADQVRAALARYEPEALGVYEAGSHRYSGLVQFLGLLVDGVAQQAVLPKRHLGDCLASGRLFFGHEAIEYRQPEATRVAAMLGIREYPTPSSVGMFNRLLTVPFSFVLTQSFAFLSKSTGQSLLQRQFNRMANAGDFAISQAEALKDTEIMSQMTWHFVREGDSIIAMARTFRRVVGDESGGRFPILALAGVCTHPQHRGRGLGRAVVMAAWLRLGTDLPVSFFQTGVPAFYERLGARLVQNRIYDSTGAPRLFWDPYAMIYPADAVWPEAAIDLRGGGW